MLKNITKPLQWILLSEDNLIKMLYIAGVLALIIAGFIFMSTVICCVQENENMKVYLGSPSVIERFNQIHTYDTESQISPLLQEATTFAKFIEKEAIAQKEAERLSEQAEKLARGLKEKEITEQKAAKNPTDFKIYGTCYYKSQPELSLALIGVSDKKRHWIQQSDKKGSFIIDQIRDGFIIVSNGEVTFNLPVETELNIDSSKEVHLASTFVTETKLSLSKILE